MYSAHGLCQMSLLLNSDVSELAEKILVIGCLLENTFGCHGDERGQILDESFEIFSCKI